MNGLSCKLVWCDVMNEKIRYDTGLEGITLLEYGCAPVMELKRALQKRMSEDKAVVSVILNGEHFNVCPECRYGIPAENLYNDIAIPLWYC